MLTHRIHKRAYLLHRLLALSNFVTVGVVKEVVTIKKVINKKPRSTIGVRSTDKFSL